jgi:uncharacterized RDD family membrane protein YckC
MRDLKPFASLGRRLVAFLIDVVPITAGFFALFYFTTDFGKTVDRFLAADRTIENRRQFIEERNRVRDVSGLAYLFYAAALEASRMQGTIGKRIVGIQVIDLAGRRIGFRRALGRNLSKMLSFLPAFIGCIAAFWSTTKQTWHDRVAKTYVTVR